VDGLMMDFPLTLNVILRRAETIHSKREVVTKRDDGTWHRYTYADMARRARQLAVALGKLGIGPGDRVATICWNHYAHLEAYFAVPCSGAVLHTINPRLHEDDLVTINPRLHEDDLVHILKEAEDRIVLVDQSMFSVLEKVLDRVALDHVIVFSDDECGSARKGTIDYNTLIEETDAVGYEFPEFGESQAAAMCYTSGTTGKPKGVLYSHRAIVLHTLGSALPGAIGIREQDSILPVVPMFHVNAWGIPYTCAMMGSKLVFPGRHLDPKSLLDAFAREKVTVSAGVPTIWIPLLEELNQSADQYDLSALHSLIVGGAAAPKSLMIELQERHDINLVHAWGMTETTPLGTAAALRSGQETLSEDEQYAVRLRQGHPVPFVEIRARGEEGIVAWDGKTMGELEVRGPWIAGSYYKRPDGATQFTDDGWFRTGDIVTIDASGSMKIEDRAKDLIKSGGEWISSIDLENTIMSHPAVSEAAVIAIPHKKWTERPLAVVVTRDTAKVTADELREYLSSRVAKWWIPDAFEFVEAIPKTATGKFKKLALREQFAGNG